MRSYENDGVAHRGDLAELIEPPLAFVDIGDPRNPSRAADVNAE